MRPSPTGSSSYAITLAGEPEIGRLVTDVAAALKPGELITLSGDLGAGKTTFARALIRRLAGDADIEVPSPTFTLMQIYELPRWFIAHVDLYRVSSADELAELGLDDLPFEAVTLMEWPDRAETALPPDRIDIAFALVPARGPDHRNVTITGHGRAAQRVERMGAIRRLLDESGWGDAERRPLAGDASTRAYERLHREKRDAILMNAPRRPDGPAVKDGKPYSAIARLAEDVTPFVAMDYALRAHGLSAPVIYAADLADGVIILEDLGDEGVVSGGDPPAPVAMRYQRAVDLLGSLHTQALPDTLPVAPKIDYRLPPYDLDAFMIEVELLIDWYLPHCGKPIDAFARAQYLTRWRDALGIVLAAPRTWVLRDFHSPNLLWRPERSGVAAIGLLDFQDAVMGPAAYDLASLLQDARVDVPDTLELELLGRYVRWRRQAEPAFDVAGFARLYATLAAQRASKILGIFARLDRRDGKRQYLKHMPRVWAYLKRSLAHPALEDLAQWYADHVPPPPPPSTTTFPFPPSP